MGMATPTGFEPAISTVTGWHVSPLHHGANTAQKEQMDFYYSAGPEVVASRIDSTPSPCLESGAFKAGPHARVPEVASNPLGMVQVIF